MGHLAGKGFCSLNYMHGYFLSLLLKCYITFLFRPSVHDDKSDFTISKGKHPIIDTLLGEHEQFVPNDTNLDVCILCALIVLLRNKCLRAGRGEIVTKVNKRYEVLSVKGVS